MDDILAGFEVGRKIVESTEMHNTARVAYAVKQLIKEAAVGKLHLTLGGNVLRQRSKGLQISTSCFNHR